VTIECFVLAAGKSTRMGGVSKLSQKIGDMSLICHVIENLRIAGVNSVTVIYGDCWGVEELELPAIATPLRNENAENGIGSSIALAATSLPSTATRLLFALADMPKIMPETILALMQKSADNDANIWVPTYRGKQGHPVIFSRDWVDELTKLDGDRGGASLFAHENAKLACLEVEDPGILMDIDTPADLSKLRAKL
jgi:molybdenum cofactor cytidylyltransferase